VTVVQRIHRWTGGILPEPGTGFRHGDVPPIAGAGRERGGGNFREKGCSDRNARQRIAQDGRWQCE
jgi:hypothetical protein